MKPNVNKKKKGGCASAISALARFKRVSSSSLHVTFILFFFFLLTPPPLSPVKKKNFFK